MLNDGMDFKGDQKHSRVPLQEEYVCFGIDLLMTMDGDDTADHGE